MGSQRRLIEALKDVGITDPPKEIMRAIEDLGASGDDFWDAIYELLQFGEPADHFTIEERDKARKAAIEALIGEWRNVTLNITKLTRWLAEVELA